MADAPRPPLPDMDWTEAVELAENAVVDAAVAHGYSMAEANIIADAVTAAAVNAAWPILHAAAQPTSVEYGLGRGIDIVPGHSRDGAISTARVLNGIEPGSVEVVCRTLGDWQPVEWEEANADD